MVNHNYIIQNRKEVSFTEYSTKLRCGFGIMGDINHNNYWILRLGVTLYIDI